MKAADLIRVNRPEIKCVTILGNTLGLFDLDQPGAFKGEQVQMGVGSNG
ncbi:MAG: hypothetical protein ACE5GK_07445 [Nitrospiria bacterium]